MKKLLYKKNIHRSPIKANFSITNTSPYQSQDKNTTPHPKIGSKYNFLPKNHLTSNFSSNEIFNLDHSFFILHKAIQPQNDIPEYSYIKNKQVNNFPSSPNHQTSIITPSKKQ